MQEVVDYYLKCSIMRRNSKSTSTPVGRRSKGKLKSWQLRIEGKLDELFEK
jgi:hypothetical protein